MLYYVNTIVLIVILYHVNLQRCCWQEAVAPPAGGVDQRVSAGLADPWARPGPDAAPGFGACGKGRETGAEPLPPPWSRLRGVRRCGVSAVSSLPPASQQ